MTKQTYELIEEVLAEQALNLEEKKHDLDNKKKMDRVQLSFSRILMAAAILTMGLILLSSLEVPYVSVRPDIVKLLIDVVIVELSGIVTLVLTKHLEEEEHIKN